jgi:ElaB/YqjD/DUF883 family membrane-anchored ribosome-binding protein
MVDVNKVSEIGRQAAEQGYETVKEYAGKSVDAVGDVSDDLTEFVRHEPWIALAAAFAVGYLAARVIRRVSN